MFLVHINISTLFFNPSKNFLQLLVLIKFSITGFDGVDHCDISNHFAQFTFSTGGLKSRRSFLQLVWLLTVWVLWNERNNRLFKQKENFIVQLLDKVKYHSMWWLKAKNVVFMFGDYLWLSNLLSCLGIG
jgi:hypothetical protein